MPERDPVGAIDSAAEGQRGLIDGRGAPPAGSAAEGQRGVIDLPATFGKYFLTEKLATGGMAEIYLGKLMGPGGFEKQLVIKQIHPRLSGQRHFVDLFVAEAKTLVTLAHGNIVPVYELGVLDDTYFIAMDYIDGPTLYRFTEAVRRRGDALAPAVAAWVAARILEGLDYAHRKGEGVIHRDLSPRNVMLSRDGEIKLVDFGIAVTLGAGGEDEAGQSAPTGSFPYMSPEQVRKEPLTGQTDLFSVGVLLWEMLVGRRLFARDDPDATLTAVIDGEIPLPSALQPAVPARLDEVVMRALERDMTSRWPTAADMLAALQRYLYSLDDPPGPRDVAALVARYCPPETRRLPTHHDPADVEAAPITPPRGPSTIAIPREAVNGRAPTNGVDAPRGPSTIAIPRKPRARTETFATHVAFDQILERAVPAGLENTAPADEPIDPNDPTAPFGVRALVEAAAATPGNAAAVDPGDEIVERPHGPQMPQLSMRPPSTAALLVLGGIGAFGLSGAAVYVFYKGRGAVLRADASMRDAGNDAAPGDALLGDAPPPGDAAVPDAIAPADARTPIPHDAAVRPPPLHLDAPIAPPADAALIRTTATLTIGANPWGDVVLDGRKIGRTPIEHLTVPAGRHTVEVTFGGEDPPRTQRFNVDLSDGETRSLAADFKP